MKFEWQSMRAGAKLQAPNTQTPKKLQNPISRVLGFALAIGIFGTNGFKTWAQDAVTNAPPAIGASADDIRALRQKIEELERKVKDLEEKNKPEA